MQQTPASLGQLETTMVNTQNEMAMVQPEGNQIHYWYQYPPEVGFSGISMGCDIWLASVALWTGHLPRDNLPGSCA